MKRSRFTPEFKRSIVKQLLSETAGPAELRRTKGHILIIKY
jgi:transposase-like protein